MVQRTGELVPQCPIIDLMATGLLNEQAGILMLLLGHSTKSLFSFSILLKASHRLRVDPYKSDWYSRQIRMQNACARVDSNQKCSGCRCCQCRLLVRVDQGVMAMKRYSTFPKVQRLESYHQKVQIYIQDTRWGGSYPSEEMQLTYSTAPANWAKQCLFQNDH